VAYSDARAQIKTFLDGLSINDPLAADIKRVYEKPPATIEDTPCFVLFGAIKKPERRPGGWRIVHYRLRVQLFVQDADADRAAAMAESFGDALINTVDGQLQLAGQARLVHEEVGEVVGLEYPRGSGRHYVGFDAFFDIPIQADVTYGAGSVSGAVAYDPACTLTGGIGVASSAAAYTSTGDPISQFDIIQIDDEQILVANVVPSVNGLTLGRGYGGTTPATHALGAAILFRRRLT